KSPELFYQGVVHRLVLLWERAGIAIRHRGQADACFSLAAIRAGPPGLRAGQAIDAVGKDPTPSGKPYVTRKGARFLVAKGCVIRQLEGVSQEELAQGRCQGAGADIEEDPPDLGQPGQPDPFEDRVRKLPGAAPLGELAAPIDDQ